MLKLYRVLHQVINDINYLMNHHPFNVFNLFILVFNDASMQNRLVAGATVLIVFIVVLAIVATVLVLRTKNQDDLDKKTSNHLPLPLDYASNEGTCLELWSNVPTLKFLLKSIFYLLFSHFHLLFEIQSHTNKFSFSLLLP